MVTNELTKVSQRAMFPNELADISQRAVFTNKQAPVVVKDRDI
jgi:hypothetical protein